MPLPINSDPISPPLRDSIDAAPYEGTDPPAIVSISDIHGYSMYEDIEEKEGVDGHLAVTHSDTYVIGDAHTNTCENRHSFLRQWLANFRGVSKHHLQKYLNFLALRLNSPEDWFEKLLCYNVSG